MPFGHRVSESVVAERASTNVHCATKWSSGNWFHGLVGAPASLASPAALPAVVGRASVRRSAAPSGGRKDEHTASARAIGVEARLEGGVAWTAVCPDVTPPAHPAATMIDNPIATRTRRIFKAVTVLD